MADTSVIIPCWIIDEIQLKLTYSCIDSIRATSDVELIIIDNGSVLGKEYLQSEADIYIPFEKNMGYVKAINAGFAIAHGKYIVAGNNDYRMVSGWEEAQIEVLDKVNEAGIACLHTEGSPKAEQFWEETGTPGGWWMIKRETLDKLGYLDEIFFNVFADYDFLWRMRKETGLRVIATPKVTVYHHGEVSLSRFDKRFSEYNHGQWIILNKWKDDPCFYKFCGDVINPKSVDKWMKEHSEYSKSVDYSS